MMLQEGVSAVIPAISPQRREDHYKFNASLVCIVRLNQKGPQSEKLGQSERVGRGEGDGGRGKRGRVEGEGRGGGLE